MGKEAHYNSRAFGLVAVFSLCGALSLSASVASSSLESFIKREVSEMLDEGALQTDALHIGDYITLKEVTNEGYMSAEGVFSSQ